MLPSCTHSRLPRRAAWSALALPLPSTTLRANQRSTSWTCSRPSASAVTVFLVLSSFRQGPARSPCHCRHASKASLSSRPCSTHAASRNMPTAASGRPCMLYCIVACSVDSDTAYTASCGSSSPLCSACAAFCAWQAPGSQHAGQPHRARQGTAACGVRARTIHSRPSVLLLRAPLTSSSASGSPLQDLTTCFSTACDTDAGRVQPCLKSCSAYSKGRLPTPCHSSRLRTCAVSHRSRPVLGAPWSTMHGAQHNTAQPSPAQPSPAQHCTAQHCTAQPSTALHSTACSTAQHSTAQHSTAQHSTAQHSIARHVAVATLVCDATQEGPPAATRPCARRRPEAARCGW
jgi:hypothetical protein